MRSVGWLPFFLAVLIGFFTGCETTPTPAGQATKPKPPSRAAEAEIRRLSVAGAKLGDTKAVLRRFPQAKRVGSGRTDWETFEVYKPNPQISILLLTFRQGRLVRMELRYFNGPTEQTLRKAGGWDGLRNVLVQRFGPPVKTGAGVPLLTTLRPLNPAYARFNGVWDFPRAGRQIHYVALSDNKGGVGVITFVDSSPLPEAEVRAAAEAARPNPGF